MNIGKKGLDLIKSFEGLRLKAYLPTPNDVWTIGYGHTKTAKKGAKITAKKAEVLLVGDVEWVQYTIANNVKVSLTQNQYDALCSFIYNLGATNFTRSTLLKKLNRGDYEGAADELLRWNKQGKTVLRGLTRRREAERALFLSEDPVAHEEAQQGPTGLLEALLDLLTAILAKGR